MLLWGGETLSELGSQTTTVAYPLLILALTGSAAKAGVVGFAKWLPLAVFALPAGMLADRVDRKRLMIACDAVRAAGAASIVAALVAGRPAYAQVIGVAFLDGALFTTSYITERGALRQLMAPEQLPDAVAQNDARMFAASVSGPPLGGVLFALARALPFVADAVSFALSMVAISLTRSEFQAPRNAPRGSGWASMVEGVVWLWRRPFFRVASLLFSAGNALYTGLYLLAVLLAKHHGASSADVGVMFAIVGVGGLAGAIVAAPLRRRVTPRASMAGELWLIVATAPLLLIAHAPVLIGLVVASAEFLTPLTNSIVSGSRVAMAPDHLQARVQAASTMLSMSLGWLGPLAIGLAFQHGGPTLSVLLVIACALALTVTTMLAPALGGIPGQGAPSGDRVHTSEGRSQCSNAAASKVTAVRRVGPG
jgi:MFS family permease